MGRTSHTREKLIETASRLMWQRGFVDVGVNELCREADVKPGSFYYFFPSKTALAVEALEAHWQDTYERMIQPAAEAEDPVERLTRFITNVQQKTVENQQTYGQSLGCPFANLSGELLALDHGLRDKLEEIFERYYRFFEGLLRDAHAQGRIEIDEDKIPRKARAMFALLEGIQTLAHTHNDPGLIALLMPDLHTLMAA